MGVMTQLIIPQDKANHFTYGAVAGLAGVLVGGPVLGLAVVAVMAVVRELTGGTPFDWYDIAWTVGGGSAVCAAAHWSNVLHLL